jgi:2-dehydro-3-deoxygalactonokinase
MKTFLSCDWGTSSLRLRCIKTDTSEVLQEVTSNDGIAETHRRWKAAGGRTSDRRQFYLAVLKASIGKLTSDVPDGAPLIISGMASSSVGMEEIPYAQFPFSGSVEELKVKVVQETGDMPHPAIVVSGFRTATDIMRGEETMLLGCDIAKYEKATLVLPGTHSKHVSVVNGVARDFKTHITGEMFNLLVKHSLLSASVETGEDDDSFLSGVQAAQKLDLLNAVFTVRTRQLLDANSPASNYQYLSGLLIGTELKSLRAGEFPVVVVSEGSLMHLYIAAMKAINQDSVVQTADSREALLRGHRLIGEKYTR